MDACLRCRDLLTASLLGFSSGYITSVTKNRFGTVGGMMTGNTMQMGMSIQQGAWISFGTFAALVAGFAFGTLCELIALKQSVLGQRLWLLVFTSLLFVIDAAATALPDGAGGESVLSALAAVSLGAQNCLSQKSNVVKANTTFMTGNIQKMTEALFTQWTKGLKSDEQRATFLLVLTWSMYVVGGVVGAFASSCESEFCTTWSLTPAMALYGPGMLSMQIERPKPPPREPAAQPAASSAEAKPAADVQLVSAGATSGPTAQAIGDAEGGIDEPSVEMPHPQTPGGDGRRALGEEPQL